MVPVDVILRDILKCGAETLQVERVGYWGLEDDGKSIRRSEQYHLSRDEFDSKTVSLDAASFPIYFDALHLGANPIIADDAMSDLRLSEFSKDYLPAFGIGAMLDSPVRRQGRLFGVVCHEHLGEKREWTDADVDFARYLAQWIAMAFEIDERQRTEASLRERELLYRLLLEHSPTPTIVSEAGGDGVFLDANESALKLFAADRDTFVGSTPASFSPEFQPDGRSSEEAAREKIARMLGGETPAFDWVHQDSHGRSIPCSVHLAKVPGDGVARMIAAITDKTEQIRTEETIRRALENERELGELRARFTAIVSHEFRTPLGIIMSAIELLRNYFDRLDGARRHELFEDIHGATRRMGVLMEQVLVLGRGDAGKLNFSPEPLDLGQLCLKVAEESKMAAEARCHVVTTLENDISGATADEPLLRHIFSNLLTNAAKYSPAGSEASFLIRREDGDAVFIVEDKGIGIPKDDHSRMFEAFQRATNVGEIPGSGLGLLIAKRCAELHGGSITFVSEPGLGTVFTVRLPIFL